MSQKIGEKSFTKQIENFSESIDISRKKITKIGEILFIEREAGFSGNQIMILDWGQD